MNKLPVWIDCDPGVDDAVGLLLAHHRPELSIVGISTVSGNVHLKITTENALKLCELMGGAYPVYAGADKPLLRPYEDGAEYHGADGLGGAALPSPARSAEPEAAWDGLYKAAKAHPGTLEVVTMGPMTNLACAFAKYPDLPGLIHRVVFMGGATTRGNVTPCAEYNIYADPEAAQAVFRSGVKLVMCGLDVTERAYATEEEMNALSSMDTPLSRFFRESTGHILRKNLQDGHDGWCIHDACPVLYLAKSELFSGREAGVFVETQAELTLGKTVTDLYSDHKFEEKNTLVLLELDREAFIAAIREALS